MGDPRKRRAKFDKPLKPWDSVRLEEEKILTKEYGLKNKREIYKINTLQRKFISQAKKLSASTTKQAEIETQQLLTKLRMLGIVAHDAKLEDVLSVSAKSIMERRLQTLVFRKGHARSANQARQFIIHRHVLVDGKSITMPSYLVSKKDESLISFIPTSTLADPNHPERIVEVKEKTSKKSKKGFKEEKKETKPAEVKETKVDKKEAEEKPKTEEKTTEVTE